MLTALLLLAAASGGPCANPVAPDQASARRIAEATIRNARASTENYRLLVSADDADARLWVAYQVPINGPTRGGGGLEFRIDRCSGAVSRMHRAR